MTPEEADRLVSPVELRMRYTKQGNYLLRPNIR